MKKLYFIVNVAARNGKSLAIWNSLLGILEDHEVAYDVYFTKYCGHAAELAEMITIEKEDIAAVIAVGGDGTIHEVVNGIVQDEKKEIKIGYISAGSGNDFARGYAVPKPPKDALKFILDNIETSFPYFDVGEYEANMLSPRTFVSSLGIGFDAEVSKTANDSNLKKILNLLHLGFLTYALILLKILVSYKRKTVKLKIDDIEHVFKKVWFITISNQPYYGGGMKISPNASPCDGLLNITVVHQLSRIKLLAVFLSVFWGGHCGFKEVKMLLGKRVEIDSNEKMLIHADGEIVGYSPLKVSVKPQQVCYMSKLTIDQSQYHHDVNIPLNW